MKHLIEISDKKLKLAFKIFEDKYTLSDDDKPTIRKVISLALHYFISENGYHYNYENNEYEKTEKAG